MNPTTDLSVDPTPDPTTDALTVTVSDAAKLLGLSSEAVRMRVKRGTLASTRIAGSVYVVIDRPNPEPHGTNDRPNDEPNARPNGSVGGPNGRTNGYPDAGNAGRAALLAAKDETITALREQLEAERQANRENRRIIAGLIERVPALEAAQNGQEDARRRPADGAGGVDDGERLQNGSERLSWWRRFFGLQ